MDELIVLLLDRCYCMMVHRVVRVEREQENCTYVLSVLCIKIPLIEAVTQKLKYGYGIQFCRVWGGSEYLRVKLKEIK